MKSELLGYTFDATSVEEMAGRICRGVSDAGRSFRLMALNPRKVGLAARNRRLRRSLERSEVLFPDGIGVCLAHRMLGKGRVERVPGIDLATALLEEASRRGWRVYLMGGRPVVNERAAAVVRSRHDGIEAVGRHHGYFDREEERRLLDDIVDFRPQILLVALGSPMQELWIDEHFEGLPVDVAIGVGGTLDVYAGMKDRAPAILRRSGLEWLYRIAAEPRRVRRVLDTHLSFAKMTFDEFRDS